MKKLTFTELGMVTGGDKAAGDAFMLELRKKYGGRSPLETLSRATEEEIDHLLALYEL